MTQSVFVVNPGPRPIEVEKTSRGADGRFADGGEPEVVEAGATLKVDIHPGVGFKVKEL